MPTTKEAVPNQERQQSFGAVSLAVVMVQVVWTKNGTESVPVLGKSVARKRKKCPGPDKCCPRSCPGLRRQFVYTGTAGSSRWSGGMGAIKRE